MDILPVKIANRVNSASSWRYYAFTLNGFDVIILSIIIMEGQVFNRLNDG